MLNLVVYICTAFNVFQIKQMGFFVINLCSWPKGLGKGSLQTVPVTHRRRKRGGGGGGGRGGGGRGARPPK